MSPCLRGRSGSAIWADGGCRTRQARGPVCAQHVCIHSEAGFGLLHPVPSVFVQVGGREVCKPVVGSCQGRTGQRCARHVEF